MNFQRWLPLVAVEIKTEPSNVRRLVFPQWFRKLIIFRIKTTKLPKNNLHWPGLLPRCPGVWLPCFGLPLCLTLCSVSGWDCSPLYMALEGAITAWPWPEYICPVRLLMSQVLPCMLCIEDVKLSLSVELDPESPGWYKNSKPSTNDHFQNVNWKPAGKNNVATNYLMLLGGWVTTFACLHSPDSYPDSTNRGMSSNVSLHKISYFLSPINATPAPKLSKSRSTGRPKGISGSAIKRMKFCLNVEEGTNSTCGSGFQSWYMILYYAHFCFCFSF